MDLAAYYYKEIVGVYKFPTLREEAITRCTIAYMQDSGITDKEIFSVFNSLGSKKGYIEPSDLPNELWKNSLTEKGHYYCHNAVQLVSPTPIITRDGIFKEYPFYQEMKIRFAINDLINYYYCKIPSYLILRDDKRDSAQFKHMLVKYKFSNIESLDFVLFMIDEAAYQNIPATDPFSICTAPIQQEVANRLNSIMAEKIAKGYNKNIWRTYLIEEGKIVWQTKQM